MFHWWQSGLHVINWGKAGLQRIADRIKKKMETKKSNNKRKKIVLISITNYQWKHNHDKFDTFEDETNDNYFTQG